MKHLLSKTCIGCALLVLLMGCASKTEKKADTADDSLWMASILASLLQCFFRGLAGQRLGSGSAARIYGRRVGRSLYR